MRGPIGRSGGAARSARARMRGPARRDPCLESGYAPRKSAATAATARADEQEDQHWPDDAEETQDGDARQARPTDQRS